MNNETKGLIEGLRGEPIPDGWDPASGGTYTREVYAPDPATAAAIDMALSCLEFPIGRSVEDRAAGDVCAFIEFMDGGNVELQPAISTPRDWLIAFARYRLWHADGAPQGDRADEYLLPSKWAARQPQSPDAEET